MRANKTLGQNFLKSRRVVWQIVKTAGVAQGETVLEIGPGKGILTGALLESGANVVAIEKDERLVEHLKNTFAKEIQSGQLNLISGDVLEIDAEKFEKLGLVNSQYKLVANIPYYITGQIIRKFLSENCQPSLAVMLVQKEVADRIVARNNKESLLSLAVKAYGKPKRIAVVKRTEFSPAPNVDSAILLIDKISKKFFENNSEEKFFNIIHAGFAHKRKLLIKNLEKIATREALRESFTKCNLNEKVRAEDVTLADWQKLTGCLLL